MKKLIFDMYLWMKNQGIWHNYYDEAIKASPWLKSCHGKEVTPYKCGTFLVTSSKKIDYIVYRDDCKMEEIK